ncbi:MAG: phytoene/squalene synthase family protein [Pseudomonadota bacterium]
MRTNIRPTLPANLVDYCRRVTSVGSKSFYAASRLLPRHVRPPVYALYAFCRRSDDAVDLSGPGSRPVAWLQDRLNRVYAGRPADDPIDEAFALTVTHWNIPKALPDALLEGFEWDLSGRSYRTLEDVYAYSARVAGTVGAMMAVIMGARSPTAVSRACDLGVAMQLTNIARDVGEDARAGRLYLPTDWFDQVGLDPTDFLQSPAPSELVAGLTRRLIAAAAPLYERGLSGVGSLDQGCRPGIRAAGLIYREIGRQLLAAGGDSVSHRTIVSKSRKLALLTEALATPSDIMSEDPPLEETAFLVRAVQAASHDGNDRDPEAIDHFFDVMFRLEARDRRPISFSVPANLI